jgi:nitrate/nitrite transport system permease protein
MSNATSNNDLTLPPIAMITQRLAKSIRSIDIKGVVYPLLGIFVFCLLWGLAASRIDTSLGQFPGPTQVYSQALVLVGEHQAERVKETAFYQRQDNRNAKKLAKNPDAITKVRQYTGKETFFDQILTSLKTVLFGFLVASFIAIPAGIACGLSDGFYKAMNPLIQIFKPVSPLAWLPLITMVVSASYISESPFFEKSFLVSAFTVSLCCLWPTLINTAVGVANVDKDLLNVSRVIKLPTTTHIRRIILPASVPMIFTGLRLSLATGWMVLIAAEMLSQNPGLGKFVWDEFQNGSSNSLARIMVAVVVIGLIGFALDRFILVVQKTVSWDKLAVLR